MQKIRIKINLTILIIATLNVLTVNAQNKAQCLNSKNNYLYAGVDNEVQIIVPENNNFDTLLVSISNGEIYKDSTLYNCIPRRSGRAKLVVKGINHNLDTLDLLTESFMVYTIPPAKLTVGGKIVDELLQVDKEFLLENDVFGIHFSDDIINCENWVNIEKITMGYLSSGGFYKRNEFKGNKLPDEFKEIITSLPSGKQLSFEVRLSYTGNVQKNLPVFVTKVY